MAGIMGLRKDDGVAERNTAYQGGVRANSGRKRRVGGEGRGESERGCSAFGEVSTAIFPAGEAAMVFRVGGLRRRVGGVRFGLDNQRDYPKGLLKVFLRKT